MRPFEAIGAPPPLHISTSQTRVRLMPFQVVLKPEIVVAVGTTALVCRLLDPEVSVSVPVAFGAGTPTALYVVRQPPAILDGDQCMGMPGASGQQHAMTDPCPPHAP